MTSAPIISSKGLTYIKYLPRIIRLIKNWLAFLLNYAGIKDKGETYCFRDGLVIKTGEGIDCTTISVVYIKKEYDKILTINFDIGRDYNEVRELLQSFIEREAV